MNDLTVEVISMSSLEIAELTGKAHDHVIRDIANMLIELELEETKFGAVYTSKNNQERKCYNLDKELTTILVSGYSIKLRAAIVKRWIELEDSNKPRTIEEVTLANCQALVDAQRELAKIPLLVNQVEAITEQLVTDVQSSHMHTVLAYCGLRKIQCLQPRAKALGKLAAKYCREHEEVIGTQSHARFGSVNTYPTHVLDIIVGDNS